MERQAVIDFIFALMPDVCDRLRGLQKDCDDYWSATLISISDDGEERSFATISVPDWWPEGYVLDYTA